jgi:uncharacterized protein (DUF433 family)
MNEKKSYEQKIKQIYGDDPKEMPLYGISQAANYLKIPLPTLRTWIRGRKYPVGQNGEMRFSEPVIKPPKPNLPMLSFMNLVEAHVLKGIRKVENIPFYKVRDTIAFVEKELQSKHPLADYQFLTDGIELFIEHLGELVAVSKRGQLVFRELFEAYLRRIDRNPDKTPIRLFPFLKRNAEKTEPKVISINPLVSFGRPVIVGTGVPTEIIAERFQAGDSLKDLMEDYGTTEENILEAIRYEYKKAA